MGVLRGVLAGESEPVCRAKNDRRDSKRENTAILRRRGWADEALESRRELLRCHFCERLYPLQGGNICLGEERHNDRALVFDCPLHRPTGDIDQVHMDG